MGAANRVSRVSETESETSFAELCEGLLVAERCADEVIKHLQKFLEDKTHTSLNLNHNKIQVLPKKYFADPRVAGRLKDFQCTYNQLEELPPELGNCVNLEMLWCGDNQLRKLPRELSACAALEMIYCATNQLEEFPPELSACAKLEMINCVFNQLEEFPPELGACANLKELSCDNNPLKEGTPRTPQELRDQWAQRPHTKRAEKE